MSPLGSVDHLPLIGAGNNVSAASMRRSATAVQLEVRTVLVCDILKTKGSVVMTGAPSDSTLSLAERRVGALIVTDGESVCGIVSARDISYGLAGHGARIFTQSGQIGA